MDGPHTGTQWYVITPWGGGAHSGVEGESSVSGHLEAQWKVENTHTNRGGNEGHYTACWPPKWTVSAHLFAPSKRNLFYSDAAGAKTCRASCCPSSWRARPRRPESAHLTMQLLKGGQWL